ncbi:cytidylate kinase-like family protein [Collinsella tanakaei]|uniref:cytidylate kinase-like family protein n=1 Tax=Collinsella tanakaei TaxID=626935 RepID=UPI00195C8510|nr:cytidylate kinase-like family protein [Collinsella tanakaei]MBM6755175.1 cytidylate kinase-like family protein [Collinsella tanakaei]
MADSSKKKRDVSKLLAQDLYNNENLGAPTEEGSLEYPVVITIAREYGTDAHEIGIALQERLSIPLYDNELLIRAARRADTVVDKVAPYDESVAAEMMAFLPDRFDSRTLADQLFESLKQVILDVGSSESCIIIGRLSDYILRDNPNLINVYVTAPLEERVEIVCKRRGITESQALKRIKKMQRNRELFYKRYSAGKTKLRAHKDLVVNRALFGVEGTCDIIAEAYRVKMRELGLMKAE